MQCSNCNKEIGSRSKYCKYCGTKTINYQEPVKPKQNILPKILFYILLFVVIAETVFFILSYSKIKDLMKSPKEEVIKETISDNNVYAFGGLIKLDNNSIGYVKDAKLVVNAPNYNLTAVTQRFPYIIYASQKTTISSKLTNLNYVVESVEEVEFSGINRLIFKISYENEKKVIIYSVLKEGRTILIELDNEDYMNDVLTMFDNIVLEPKENTLIDEFISN